MAWSGENRFVFLARLLLLPVTLGRIADLANDEVTERQRKICLMRPITQ